MPLDSVRKIAVLRANSLGDFVFALPALAALRSTYPRAEIVLLALKWHAQFLNGRPNCVDRVVVLPPITGVSLPDTPQYAGFAAPQAFMDAMHAEHFDVAVQLHGGGYYSNPFISHLGARQTIGMRADGAPPLDRWIRYIYYQSEILRFLEVVALADAAPVTCQPALSVTQGDRAELTAAVGKIQRPFVVLHPGATDRRRRWPLERFAELGDRLFTTGLQIVLTSDESESELADTVAQLMSVRALNLAGQLSLGALCALLQSARVVVGNDTGPAHLARAVGAPTATIYWCGNLINGGPPFRHRDRPLISWVLHCPVCGELQTTTRCAHDPSFMTGVTVDETQAQVLDLLAL